MAEQYVGMSIAVVIVAASIALAGILIGVGRAFGYKRVENFGVDELAQSVINAAIIGGLASVIALMSGISSSLVTTQCGTGDAPAQLACTLGGVKAALVPHMLGTPSIVYSVLPVRVPFTATVDTTSGAAMKFGWFGAPV